MNTSSVGWLVNFRTYNILQNCNSEGNFVTRITACLRGSVTAHTLEFQIHEKMAGMEVLDGETQEDAPATMKVTKLEKLNLCHKVLSFPSLFLLFFFCFQHHFLLIIDINPIVYNDQ